MKTKYNKIFNINFSQTTESDLSKDILDGNLKSKVIVTPNVDHVVRMNKDKSFADIYRTADIFINDSRILELISGMMGDSIGHVIPGSDLTKNIIESASQNEKLRITVVGCPDECIDIVRSKYQLSNLSHYNPPMGFIKNTEEVEKCLQFCQDSQPDIIFLCVGSPRQEILAEELRKRNVQAAMLCVGASLLFLSGHEKRAPKFIQKLKLEWLFRLANNPIRLAKRYLVDGPNIFIIAAKGKFSN